MKINTLITVILALVFSVHFSCSKDQFDNCGQLEGICLRVQNNTGYDLDSLIVAGLDFGHIESRRTSSFRVADGVYEHVGASFVANQHSFDNYFFCATGVPFFDDGIFTVQLEISDFDNRQFATKLIKND